MSKLLVIAHRSNEESIALTKAIDLAKQQNLSLHVMAFCYQDIDSIHGIDKDDLASYKQASIDKKHQWLLDELAELDQQQIKITTEVQWQQDIHESVISEITTNTYLYVVTQRHRTESLFHTPTEWYLLRESIIPVFIADVDKWQKNTTLLAAIDLKNESVEGIAMTNNILATATEYAKSIGGSLHCVFSIDLPEVLIDLDIINKDAYQAKVKAEYLPKLRLLAAKYGIESERLHIRFGSAEKCIASIATKAKANVVFIGSMARKGLKGKLIGNTAEKLAGNLHTDVLVIPPM